MFLPNDMLWLGGKVSWRIESPELYLEQTGAKTMQMEPLEFLAPGGYRSYAVRSGANKANASALKVRMLEFLAAQDAPHLYLNLSEEAKHVWSGLQPPVFVHLADLWGLPRTLKEEASRELYELLLQHALCLGRLMSEPRRRLGLQVEDTLRRLPRKYTAVHVRTGSADMRLPRGWPRDLNATLRVHAWDR